MTRPKIAAGNWKMNGLQADLAEVRDLRAEQPAPGCEVILCPPATLLVPMAEICADSLVALGGQDCHNAKSGAHTGDISAEMLAEAGARYVIVGHSERRADHSESDTEVRAKAEAALSAGLTPIICVGETLAQREAGQTLAVVTEQVSGSLPSTKGAVIVAYEPVWAIGTGHVATLAQIAEVHDALRAQVGEDTPLLYGGSVKPSNAADIFGVGNVDGALVGGASLKAADFGAIITALSAA